MHEGRAEGRAFHGLAISYATNPRDACHLKGDYYDIDLGNMILEYMVLPSDRMVSEGKGEPRGHPELTYFRLL